jgi:hypothetical protein
VRGDLDAETDDLRERIAELRGEVSELKSFRDNLTGALGPMAGGGDGGDGDDE